ncbi:MAG: hypothetical protein SVK08_01670 [Halobacteriota archaeon]|nr:hypothetical protein [Halobacteriota archaeon]
MGIRTKATKRVISFYIDNDVIRELRKTAQKKDRSSSYLVNSLLRKELLRGKPKPKKYLDPDSM